MFAFLLNLPWEFWQVPFFAGMGSASHWAATVFCTRAALGDAGIAVTAFWVAALAVQSRRWILTPKVGTLTVFLLTGLLITVVFERLATGPLDRWLYAETMPVVPALGVGLLPLLQWILLPPLVVWFVKRQLEPVRP